MAYNNAYDFERFAVRENQPKKTVIKRFPQQQKQPNKRRSMLLYTATAIAIALAVFFNIHIRTQINDTQREIAKADKQIETLSSEQTRLNVKLENVVSYSTLEEEAIKLGMQKRSKSQVHYIDTSSDDYAEIIDD